MKIMTQTLLGYAFLPWRRKRIAQRILNTQDPVSHSDLTRFLRTQPKKQYPVFAVLLWDALPVLLAVLTDSALHGVAAAVAGSLLFLFTAYTPERENEGEWMLLKMLYMAFNIAMRGNWALPVAFLCASRLLEDHARADQ